MKVSETSLQELLGGARQFRVPLFQRTYTWDKTEHAQLWGDVVALYADVKDADEGESHGHFIGSFVLAPSPSTRATMPTFLVIDGQQRLTTLTLLLAALREAAAAIDPQAYERITNSYLVNPYKTGNDHWKFVPTERDRPAYEACINGAPSGSGKDLITKAYRYFQAVLSQPDADGDPLDLDMLEQVVTAKLAIVDITAQADDNVHRIFESLNATGVGLSQADLLRNYLFMLLPSRAAEVHRDVWLPMQEDLGVERLEGLARVDIRRRGIKVKDNDVYRAQQTRLRPIEGDESAIEAEIRDLAVRSVHYGRIIEPHREVHPGVRNRLEFLLRWRATVTDPVVMQMYEARDAKDISADEMEIALHNIESFLVRRFLGGSSANNLNNIFGQLVVALRERTTSFIETIRSELSRGRRYWATDAEVQTAAQSRPFYAYGRAEQRRMVLERLEQSFGHKELGDLSQLALSVEHVMPQTLSQGWIDQLVESESDPAATHRELLHTLGNLTLTAYNSELSNDPFERKQQILSDSKLSINEPIAAEAVWGRAEIESRAAALAERAIQTWLAPEPQQNVVFGFDWSRMHAAMAATPAGSWTTYGELATLAGTSAQAVGAHIAANPGLAKAYRVLSHGGVVSAGFAWPDPSDERDPVAVLKAEGVSFSDSAAAPAQRLNANELLDLIEGFDLVPDREA